MNQPPGAEVGTVRWGGAFGGIVTAGGLSVLRPNEDEVPYEESLYKLLALNHLKELYFAINIFRLFLY